jgi:hypothetical protein
MTRSVEPETVLTSKVLSVINNRIKANWDSEAITGVATPAFYLGVDGRKITHAALVYICPSLIAN